MHYCALNSTSLVCLSVYLFLSLCMLVLCNSLCISMSLSLGKSSSLYVFAKVGFGPGLATTKNAVYPAEST